MGRAGHTETLVVFHWIEHQEMSRMGGALQKSEPDDTEWLMLTSVNAKGKGPSASEDQYSLLFGWRVNVAGPVVWGRKVTGETPGLGTGMGKEAGNCPTVLNLTHGWSGKRFDVYALPSQMGT